MLVADFNACRRGGRTAWLAYIRGTINGPEDTFCTWAATKDRLRPWNSPVPTLLDDYTEAELEKLAGRAEEFAWRWAEQNKAG